MNASTTCLLYSNCIPVKGATHSIICDLQRSNYVQIPTDLYNVLTQHRGKPIDAIKASYDNKYDDIIDNYFKLLIDNEFAFITDTPELFPEMDLEWDEPMEVSNAILDFDLLSEYNWKSALEQLSDLHCKFVQFRFYHKIEMKKIIEIICYLDAIESNTIGVDFVLPFPANAKLKDFVALFQGHRRINTIVLNNSPHGKKVQHMGASRYLIQTEGMVQSEKSCGMIDKSTFSIHLKTFAESQKHNTCLNGKISIDKRGDIRNCPSMPKNFGNIDDTSLSQALKDKHFKKYWNINKDQIDVCKDCEFRYICTDCRAYTKDPSNDKSKPMKCGYDPYAGKWLNHSTSQLKKNAVVQKV